MAEIDPDEVKALLATVPVAMDDDVSVAKPNNRKSKNRKAAEPVDALVSNHPLLMLML